MVVQRAVLFLPASAGWDPRPSPAPPVSWAPPLPSSAPSLLFPYLAPVVSLLQLSLPRRLVSPTAPGPAHCPYSQDSQTANPSFRPPPLAVREERSFWGWAWVCAISKPSNLTPAPDYIHKPVCSPASGGDTTPSLAVTGGLIGCKSAQARAHFLRFLPGPYLDPPQREKLGQVQTPSLTNTWALGGRNR